jgi:uncharacterized protein (DUF433 family)
MPVSMFAGFRLPGCSNSAFWLAGANQLIARLNTSRALSDCSPCRAVARMDWDNNFSETDHMSWKERITVNPAVCHGKACIRGTRVMVSVILDNLAAGNSVEEIMRGYHLESDDVQAAIQYAAELARAKP